MKALKKMVAVVSALTLTLGMCVNVFAKSPWGEYIGFDGKPGHTWYEASEGKVTENTTTGWTVKLDAIGWGGVWGCQMFLDSKQGYGNISVKKGQEYTLKCKLSSSKLDKWIVIKVATGDNTAYAKWVHLKKGKTTTLDETFTAKCDASSVYFGLGGEFGDRDDEKKTGLYDWAEGGQKSISDGKGDVAGKGTTIKCSGFSFGEKAATTSTGTTTQTSTTNTNTKQTVATGDFTPIACGAAAILAASVIVVFARKREND